MWSMQLIHLKWVYAQVLTRCKVNKKYPQSKVTGLLSMLLNVMFLYNYLPCKFIDAIIVPIINNKGGLITDKDNYRPIIITSAVSKMLGLLFCRDYSFSRNLLVICLYGLVGNSVGLS